MKNKKFIYSYIIILLLILVVIFYREHWFLNKRESIVKMPSNFKECLASGFPIEESYPRVCRLPSGQNFTEDIGNALEKSELIVVDSPRPNSIVSNPLLISGKARGTWFFEASFPISLIDEQGKEIAKTTAQAQADWMTVDFIPFTAKITIPENLTGQMKLILKKDNPSGDDTKNDQLIIPLIINN